MVRATDDVKILAKNKCNTGEGSSHLWGKEIFHGRTKITMFVEFKDVHTWDNRCLRHFCYYTSHFLREVRDK